ncbi:MAG: NAD-dependent epimerase/dehydratase family protein [Deltaproteobacteria bacterium]|nr:MAG: NAD-dependent epimerase/dehydratase family protein [Deltaproteobacteria bacterium]
MSRRVLVTGGTGFLGEHVVRQLVGAGDWDVRVVARSHSPVLDALDVEVIRADVTCDDAELARALDGCDGVFHLAGLVSRDPDDGQLMMRIHVDGTRKVLRAAAAAGVPRVVVASTSGTVAVAHDDTPRDETAPYATEIVARWPYYLSKIYQEKEAFALGDELAIEVVCVNPSLLLGPGDRRVSSTGDVQRFLNRQIPVVPKGGMNFVDVRDAAAATIAAMDRGTAGERYLLGGPNWTVEEFFGRLSRIAKVPPPRLRLPSRLQRAGASVLERVYKRFDRTPPVDRQSVEMGEVFWYVDASKARRELGFDPREPAETLVDTVRYLREGTV